MRNPEQSQQAILNAAEALFADHGLEAVSMRQIAANAGVTKSLIHHHFDSKLALWNAVKSRCLGDFAQRLTDIFAQPEANTKMLQDITRTYFEFLGDHPELPRMWAWSCLEQEQKTTDDKALMQTCASKIAQAQAAGHVRTDVDPVNVVLQIIAQGMQWQLSRQKFCAWTQRTDEQRFDQQYLDHFLTVLISGLEPQAESH